MYLLSIQGRYAPAFQLKENAALRLKQQIEAATNKQALVISSRFRSDLIYQDTTNSLVGSLKIWCELVGHDYSDSLKLKFFRSDEEQISLNSFFYRLQLIRSVPRWYELYIEELMKVFAENAFHPLCQKLSGPLEKYLRTVEQQNLKTEKEAVLKGVSRFVNLKKLGNSYNSNCN